MTWFDFYQDMLPEKAIPVYGIRMVRFVDSDGHGQTVWMRDMDEDADVLTPQVVGDLELTKLQILGHIGAFSRWENEVDAE